MWPLMSVHAVSVWDFTAKQDRVTLVQASRLEDYMSELDSMFFLWVFPRCSCPPCTSPSLIVSLSLSTTPPFSITWSDLLFAVALLSPCPRHLSLCHSRLANTAPHLYNSSPPSAHFSTPGFWTDSHIHAHTPLDYVPSPFTLPLFALEKLSAEQSITGQHHPGPGTKFFLIGLHQASYSKQYKPHIQQDEWSDYKRTHGLTFISCFLVQIFFSFPFCIGLRLFF